MQYFWDRPKGRVRALEKVCRGYTRILDVGGWWKPLRIATHVVDLKPYDTRAGGGWVGLGTGEAFERATWSQLDICSTRLPFDDKYFDFVYCGQTLEDVRDPIFVCKEMIRVGKKGLIEFPSMMVECHPGVDADARSSEYPGYERHRWLIATTEAGLLFIPKLVWLCNERFLTRDEFDYLRGFEVLWTECLWWTGDFSHEELEFGGRREIMPVLHHYFAKLREKYLVHAHSGGKPGM